LEADRGEHEARCVPGESVGRVGDPVEGVRDVFSGEWLAVVAGLGVRANRVEKMCRAMLALSRLEIIPGSNVVISALSPTTIVSSDCCAQPVTTISPRSRTTALARGVRSFMGESSSLFLWTHVRQMHGPLALGGPDARLHHAKGDQVVGPRAGQRRALAEVPDEVFEE
jgi:hypothetical protein